MDGEPPDNLELHEDWLVAVLAQRWRMNPRDVIRELEEDDLLLRTHELLCYSEAKELHDSTTNEEDHDRHVERSTFYAMVWKTTFKKRKARIMAANAAR